MMCFKDTCEEETEEENPEMIEVCLNTELFLDCYEEAETVNEDDITVIYFYFGELEFFPVEEEVEEYNDLADYGKESEISDEANPFCVESEVCRENVEIRFCRGQVKNDG